MTIVRITQKFAFRGEIFPPGSILDVDDDLAEHMIRGALAEDMREDRQSRVFESPQDASMNIRPRGVKRATSRKRTANS